jgi:hypothetical protein
MRYSLVRAWFNVEQPGQPKVELPPAVDYVADMTTTDTILHNLRWVAGFGLAGAVLSGVFLSWIPVVGAIAQEIGALVGISAGALTAFGPKRLP